MEASQTELNVPRDNDDDILKGSALEPFVSSIGVMLKERAEQFGNRSAVQEKNAEGVFQSTTWSELYRQISFAGANLISSGINPGDRVAILSENCREMMVQELAVMTIGALSVPIFAGYFPENIDYIVKHSGAKQITVSTTAQLMKLPKCKNISNLEVILVIEHDPAELQIESVCGVTVKPFADLLTEPNELALKAFFERLQSVKSEDSCLVMYTSGTTGDPKGVELTHGNLLSQQQAVRQLWDIGPEDRFLSYLPWHHSFGGLFERFMALYSGACLSIDESRGRDIGLLLSNWRRVYPTVFFSVPNVYQKLADEIKSNEKVRNEIFHSDLRFVFTAAAPLPQDVSDLFTKAGVPVNEGWGLTETSPCVTLTDPSRKRVPGVVGWPIPGVKVKLSNDGEILTVGPNVMKGYYGGNVDGKAAFTEDGWFRTGDLGKYVEGGLRILGRQDGVFKLLNAEKVFAAQIEMALIGGSDYIEQAVVVGSGRDYVVALLYPNRRMLEGWCEQEGVSFPKEGILGAISDIRRLYSSEMGRINTEIPRRYQRIRRFVIMDEPLSLEAGELTPTSKVVRHKVLEKNCDLLEHIYKPSCPPPCKSIMCLGDCYS